VKDNEKYKSLKKEEGRTFHSNGWQNQYCEHGYTNKSNLCVQYNPCQNSNSILHWDRKVNSKVHMEAKMTSNRQSNPEW
jgi:hypothetical protein